MSVVRVFVDDALIYHPNLSKLALTDLTVSEDAQAIDSLKLSMPHDHPYIDSIKPLKSIIVVKKDERTVFRGRAINDGSNFYNTHTWNCESALAFLKDSYQKPFDYMGPLKGMLQLFIDCHNSHVEKAKQFELGMITVEDNNDYIHYSSEDYLQTMKAIKDRLIKTHGGYLRVRFDGEKNILDYLKDFDESSIQSVEYGKNLLDVKITRDHSARITALIPFGAVIQTEKTKLPTVTTDAKKETSKAETGKSDKTKTDTTKTTDSKAAESKTQESSKTAEPKTQESAKDSTKKAADQPKQRVDITSVNNEVNYVYDQKAVDEIGWIWTMEAWDDVTLPSNLLRKAQQRLAELKDGVISMELSIIDESDAGADIGAIHARQYIDCKSPPHGIDGRYLVNTKTTDYLHPSNNKISIGTKGITLSDAMTEMPKQGPQGKPGADGEDGVVLKISSSKGLLFKNNSISTVLSVSVFYGYTQITDLKTLQENFGETACLQWQLQNQNSDEVELIPSDAGRLGRDGFTFSVSPDDIESKATITCSLSI